MNRFRSMIFYASMALASLAAGCSRSEPAASSTSTTAAATVNSAAAWTPPAGHAIVNMNGQNVMIEIPAGMPGSTAKPAASAAPVATTPAPTTTAAPVPTAPTAVATATPAPLAPPVVPVPVPTAALPAPPPVPAPPPAPPPTIESISYSVACDPMSFGSNAESGESAQYYQSPTHQTLFRVCGIEKKTLVPVQYTEWHQGPFTHLCVKADTESKRFHVILSRDYVGAVNVRPVGQAIHAWQFPELAAMGDWNYRVATLALPGQCGLPNVVAAPTGRVAPNPGGFSYSAPCGHLCSQVTQLRGEISGLRVGLVDVRNRVASLEPQVAQHETQIKGLTAGQAQHQVVIDAWSGGGMQEYLEKLNRGSQ